MNPAKIWVVESIISPMMYKCLLCTLISLTVKPNKLHKDLSYVKMGPNFCSGSASDLGSFCTKAPPPASEELCPKPLKQSWMEQPLCLVTGFNGSHGWRLGY